MIFQSQNNPSLWERDSYLAHHSCRNILEMLCTVLSFPPGVRVWDFKFDCTISVPSVSTYFFLVA